eukprot:CAMPEP_0196586828 /NCGR_PEP_ID=MMETSP1081-20130531/55722_1 /TAXON_ID=36882 /ORGANISM="Pyramimonas amylifera, Strain CCMP720" /LENGTH=450 /DNA_ID=CAMNT_0041908839 /DNA_START=48 /DNA_END=1400 /DNA_ORIENTATION=+
MSREPPSSCSVLVIGAGAAGLQAARSLVHTYGVRDVMVVEASEHVGGRIKTVSGVVPWDVNVGPEFVHGGCNSPLMDLIREAGWGTKKYEWPDRYWYGKESKMEEADTKDPDVEKVHELFGNMAKVKLSQGQDISALEWLRACRASEKVVALGESIYANDFGTSLRNLGVREMKVEQALWNQGDEYLVLDRPLTCVAQYLAQGLRLFTSWPVTQVHYQHSGRVHVMGGNGGVIECDCVVVAVPLSVLKDGDIQFHPPLPEFQQQALQSLDMGNAIKVSLAFEKPFWPEDMFDVVCTDCFLPEIWMIRPDNAPREKGRSNYLVTGFVAGDAADVITAAADTKDVISRSLSQLDTMFSCIKGGSSTPASDVFVQGEVHNWADEPFIRAAYSYPKIGSTGARNSLCNPVDNRIFLAGEHTDPGANPCVQAAMSTGVRAAKQIICFRNLISSRL